MSRAFSLVIGHDEHALPCPAAGINGLHDRVALVLSTWRPGRDDMLIDDALWAACMQAATRAFKADQTQVVRKLHPGFFDRLKNKPEWLVIGSLPDFIAKQLAEPDRHAWTEVHWFVRGKLIAIARCEDWFAVGGPEPYHDSYTSRIWLNAEMIEELVTGLQACAIQEDAVLSKVIRRP